MKRLNLVLLGIGSIAIAAIGFASMNQPVSAKAEESSSDLVSSSEVVSSSSETSSSSSEQPKYARITYKIGYTNSGTFASDSGRGTVDLSAESANVGDKITFSVYGNPSFETSGTKVTVFQYKCTAVWVNDVELTGTSVDRIYSFTVVDGMPSYIVTAYFDEQDNVKVTDLATTNWSGLFTVENLLKLIYFILTLFLGSGFFITLLKSKKIQAVTTNQITQTVINTLSSSTTESFNGFFTKTLTPLLDQYNIKISDMDSTMKTLLKCFTLSQENTPQARLAIAEELEKLKTSDAETTAKVKEIVNQAIAENQAKADANKKAIEEARKANENITKEAESSSPANSDEKKALPTE